jgi:hypothetical protein
VVEPDAFRTAIEPTVTASSIFRTFAVTTVTPSRSSRSSRLHAQALSFDVFVAPFSLTLAMPLAMAAPEEYIWLEPMVSPLVELRTKYG